MMQPVAAIVLDMDGTMLDTEPLYKAGWQQAAADLGCAMVDAFYLRLVGRSIADGEDELTRRFGASLPLAEFRLRWAALWRARVEADGIPTKAGLLELLAWVEDHRMPIAVATSSDRDYATLSLQRAGLAGRFATVVTGEEVAHGKPAPGHLSRGRPSAWRRPIPRISVRGRGLDRRHPGEASARACPCS